MMIFVLVGIFSWWSSSFSTFGEWCTAATRSYYIKRFRSLDEPIGSFRHSQQDDLLSFNEEVQQKMQYVVVNKCSSEVFGHGLNNTKMPVPFCKPFVLICGKSSEPVGEVTKLVSDDIIP